MNTHITFKHFILLLVLFSISTLFANTATIEKVISGDRIKIKGWEVVRLTGIKVPGPDEPFGKEAYEFAKQELEGKLVAIATYTKDNTAAGIVRDKDGLCMISIMYGDIAHEKKAKTNSSHVKALDISLPKTTDFNALLLYKGLAKVDKGYLPEHLKYYIEIEKLAQKEKVGIWK